MIDTLYVALFVVAFVAGRWWHRRRAPELRVPMTAKRVAELYDRDVH